MSSFKTILLVCFCLASFLTANPIHRIRELDSVSVSSGKSFQPLHGSRYQITTVNTNGKLCNALDTFYTLHCRTQDFCIWRSRPHELIYPVSHSALVLRDYYYKILRQVKEQWLLEAPLPSFWCRQRNSELLFHSVGGPIPWSVVAKVSYQMLCAIQLGWIGTYDILYQSHAANQNVGVTVRIANSQHSLLPQQHLAKSRTIKKPKRRDLEKRSPMDLMSFRIRAEIFAAPYFKAFFDAITVRASNAWTSLPEKALLTATQGHFQLTVSCPGARIPWPPLASAAKQSSALADRSCVNTFDAFYEESASAITVAFSLPATSSPTRRDPPQPQLSTPLRTRSPPSPTRPYIRIANFIQTVAVVPSVLAAAKLEDFYTIIALKIETGQLDHKTPARTMVCSLWDFELVFSSDTINVPLSFVQAFAIDMAEWSSKQFSGFYDATVVGEGPLSGLVIFVQMRLKGKGRPLLYLK